MQVGYIQKDSRNSLAFDGCKSAIYKKTHAIRWRLMDASRLKRFAMMMLTIRLAFM